MADTESPDLSSSISSEENDSYYSIKGQKIILPETKIPTIALKVPEMKNDITYWQIGTASVSRVKINCLKSDVKINTDEAGTISGMFSEGYGPIATLGVAIIHVFDIPIKIHVTRSANVAPVVSDGILGNDFFEIADVCLNLNSKTMNVHGRRSPIPMLEGKDLIPDYLNLLRRRMIASSIEQEKGAWLLVSKPLAKLRDYLPPQIVTDRAALMIEILEEYVDCFHLPGEEYGFTKLLTYSIKSKENEIINVPQHALSKNDEDEIERQIEDLLKHGIIKTSESPYNSPVRLLEKKPDSRGKIINRISIDLRDLNNRSAGDAFPVPDIIDLVDQLHGSMYFTVLDLASAAYQINLAPEDREKTAFTTKSGHYEFQRMPIGIKNASQTVQRLMCDVLNDMLAANMVFVCHDDILIHSPTLEEHEVRVRRVFSLIRKAGLKLQPDKCQLFETSVIYLGYNVGYEGLRLDPEKIAKLTIEELPMKHRVLESHLGLLSNYKRFIPDFTSKSIPMYNLLKNKKTTVKWTTEAIENFRDLTKYFKQDVLLHYPDWNRQFILETSSSFYGVCAALLQKNKNSEKSSGDLPIAYASRSYSPAEAKYNKYDKERIAAMFGMETWYWYFNDLEDREFILRTNEPKAFQWFVKRKWHNSKILGRFEMQFSGQKFKIEQLSKK